MKQKNNQGFSLIEVLVAIVILAAFVVPTCSALVLSARMNAKTQALMQAQLDVSSAVETLMAEGIPSNTPNTLAGDDYGKVGTKDRFPNVIISVTQENEKPWYSVEVISNDGLIKISTQIGVAVSSTGEETKDET